MRTIHKRAFFACLAAAVCALMSACALLPQEEVRRTAPLLKQTQAEEFELSYVTRGDMALTKKIGCTYVPIQKVSLYFQVSGEAIDEMFVSAGDSVKAGALLGQLKLDGVNESIEDCEIQIETLAMRLAHSQENRALAIKRQQLLYAPGSEALSDALQSVNQSYDAQQTSLSDSLSIARLTMETLSRAREMRQLIAPIDGTVTYVRKYTDASVSSLTERAVTIADSTLSLFTASTEYWPYLRAGDGVIITVSKADYEATVADETALGLAPEAREEGKKAKMYFTLNTPTFDLEDNDKGTMILLLDSRSDVLMVHEDAVSRAGGETIVYYKDAQGMKTYKPVQLGLYANGYYEVLSGLTEGEEVIVG